MTIAILSLLVANVWAQSNSNLDRRAESFKVWNALSEERREELQDRWNEIQRRPIHERNQLRAAFDNFNRISDERKMRVLENFKVWKGLPPERREEIKSAWVKWHQLTIEKRQKLQKKYSLNK
ncbi:MAG: DUF3106 domain-containing protein [Bdellovibrionales bacterium]|nr:DUF3106 domain-containing protein [Bdellovibrionales bacterium]